MLNSNVETINDRINNIEIGDNNMYNSLSIIHTFETTSGSSITYTAPEDCDNLVIVTTSLKTQVSISPAISEDVVVETIYDSGSSAATKIFKITNCAGKTLNIKYSLVQYDNIKGCVLKFLSI